jgi:chemosensory pili system protein ChpA (sensor histidine kinase/response regulator)
VSQPVDSEFLRSVFLMEAWDTLAALEQDLPAFAHGAPEAVERLVIGGHRLRGAAALHGFPGVSALAAAIEAVAERTAPAPDAERQRAAAALDELIAALKQALDEIGERGCEDRAAIEALVGRLAVPGPTPAVPDRGAAVDELSRFFADNVEVLSYFGPEATEHLDAMSASLLRLEQEGPNPAEIAALFRAVHTLKGAAYTVGCRPMGDLAHRLEDLLGAVRDGPAALTPAVIEAVFAGADALRAMLASADGTAPDLPAAIARAHALLDDLTLAPQGAVAPQDRAGLPATGPATAPELLGPRPPIVVAAASRAALPPPPRNPLRAPGEREATQGSVRVNLERLDALMNLVGELVIARSRLERRLAQFERVGELLEFSGRRMARVVAEFERKYLDPRVPDPGAPLGPAARPVDSPAAARAGSVDALVQQFEALEFDRYDDFNILARSVGELSNDLSEIQAQLATLVRAVRDDTGHVQRLTAELRSEITRARLVPVSRLFARFARQVREIARAAGKRVALAVHDEGVEMDSSVVEQLAAPLLHLVQNAIIHGLEPEAERRAAGKPPEGTVTLCASHRAGLIHIEVADDGRGIDLDVLKRTAVARGFVEAGRLPRLETRDLLDLLFQPGFTTADRVTTAAGRGVGLDVVRTNIARLGGHVEVDTRPGAGTRFTLKLPLTIAITDAFLLRVGTEVLALPVSAVQRVLRVGPSDIRRVGGAETVMVEGELIDLVRLAEALGLGAVSTPGPMPAVAVRAGRRAAALAVDELLGKDEVVVKSLGAFLDGCGPYAGATISGTGRVVLLLDPIRLVQGGGHRAATGTTATTESRRPPRVLLVDDSISIRKFVGQMLERAGFLVVTATDGAEARERLGEISVDAVITDLEMPRLNGYELVRDLRRRPATREVPVVVLTTRAGDKHVDLARQLGVTHYVTKPVDDSRLVRLLQALVAPAGVGAVA